MLQQCRIPFVCQTTDILNDHHPREPVQNVPQTVTHQLTFGNRSALPFPKCREGDARGACDEDIANGRAHGGPVLDITVLHMGLFLGDVLLQSNPQDVLLMARFRDEDRLVLQTKEVES
jgi:hypothetical protein